MSSSGELTVVLLQHGNVLIPELVLEYNLRPGEVIDIVQLVRCKLTDPKPNVQIYVADEKCPREINWKHRVVQSKNLMTKEQLDILSKKYVVINTINAYGRNFPDNK